jgi:ankyrin repeat protein
MKLLCEHGSKELLKVIANRMLEEAIKRGSSTTVELLLETFETDPGAYGKLLFHAAEANHESVEKVKLLLDRLPEQCSQQNKAGRTLIHIAAGGKPPRLELLKLALKENIDPNLQDHKGDTALHMVTKNYAEQKNPWVTSRMAMQLLLKHGGIDVNKKNAKGKTPLHNLMVSRDLPPQLLLLWQTKKAQFVDPNAKEEDLLHSPLADLCKRRDGPQLFKYLSTQLDLDSSMDTIKYLLQAAVLDGTSEMVKVWTCNFGKKMEKY